MLTPLIDFDFVGWDEDRAYRGDVKGPVRIARFVFLRGIFDGATYTVEEPDLDDAHRAAIKED